MERLSLKDKLNGADEGILETFTPLQQIIFARIKNAVDDGQSIPSSRDIAKLLGSGCSTKEVKRARRSMRDKLKINSI